MRRLLIILRREYLAYLLTPGFLLALVAFPVIMAASIGVPALVARQAPAAKVAVLDLTGTGAGAPGIALSARIREGNTRNLPSERPARLAPLPAEISGARTPEEAGRLITAYYAAAGTADNRPAILVLAGTPDALDARLWTPRARLVDLSGELEDRLTEWLQAERMRAAGLDPERIDEITSAQVEVRTYSPEASAGEVKMGDRLPQLAGVGVSYLLCMMILMGSGMISGSVIEEKSSRVIEVLITSAHPAELLLGKVLGVLLLFLTVLGTLLGAALLAAGHLPPGVSEGLSKALFARGLLPWALVFLVSGFLMYGSLFAGLAAFCETPREAQSLAAPLSLMMVIPLLLVISAVQSPESPIIRIAAMIPPFTPFLMLLRVAENAPAWEVLTGLALMGLTTAAAIAVGVQAYRTGALSQGQTTLWSLVRRSFASRD
jgi:ABC-2 type transport system permease protein